MICRGVQSDCNLRLECQCQIWKTVGYWNPEFYWSPEQWRTAIFGPELGKNRKRPGNFSWILKILSFVGIYSTPSGWTCQDKILKIFRILQYLRFGLQSWTWSRKAFDPEILTCEKSIFCWMRHQSQERWTPWWIQWRRIRGWVRRRRRWARASGRSASARWVGVTGRATRLRRRVWQQRRRRGRPGARRLRPLRSRSCWGWARRRRLEVVSREWRPLRVRPSRRNTRRTLIPTITIPITRTTSTTPCSPRNTPRLPSGVRATVQVPPHPPPPTTATKTPSPPQQARYTLTTIPTRPKSACRVRVWGLPSPRVPIPPITAEGTLGAGGRGCCQDSEPGRTWLEASEPDPWPSTPARHQRKLP